MALFAKITILALVCPMVSAADCADGSCVINDETSLLQKQQKVTQGGKRSDDPDGGLNEAEAYNANRNEGAEPIEAAAAARINFERTLHDERDVSKEKSNAEIEQAKKNVEQDYEGDLVDVNDARIKRNVAAVNAVDKVNTARDEAIREGVEAHHVEEAAVAGKVQGLNDGLYNAHKQVQGAENEVVEKHIAVNHAEQAEAAEARREANVNAVRQANARAITADHDVAVHAHVVADAASKGMANEAAMDKHLYTHHIEAMNDIADADVTHSNAETADDVEHIDEAKEEPLPEPTEQDLE